MEQKTHAHGGAACQNWPVACSPRRRMTRSVAARLAPLTLTVFIAACGGADSNSTAAPTSPSPVSSSPSPAPSPPSPSPPNSAGCSATVTGLPSSVPAQGGRYAFAITIASQCEWRAQTDASWADVAPGSGQGNATPTLNVAEYTRFDSRTLTVTVNTQAFRITQNGVVCSYTLDPTSLDESHNGGTARIVLTTREGCPWTVTASEGWIRVLTPSGTGSATVAVELAPNSSDVRHAFLTIAGQRVNVTQRSR